MSKGHFLVFYKQKLLKNALFCSAVADSLQRLIPLFSGLSAKTGKKQVNIFFANAAYFK